MASKLYLTPETTITWAPSGGDYAFTPTSLGAAMQVGAQWDRGAGAQPGWFRWEAKANSSSGAVGFLIDLFLVQAKDTSDIPGRLGTSDATISTNSTERSQNLTHIGAIVSETAGGVFYYVTGYCFVYARYVSPAWLNRIGQPLSSSGADFYFKLTPLPPEQQ